MESMRISGCGAGFFGEEIETLDLGVVSTSPTLVVAITCYLKEGGQKGRGHFEGDQAPGMELTLLRISVAGRFYSLEEWFDFRVAIA